MVKRTVIINRVLTTDITDFSDGSATQNDWKQADNWNRWTTGLSPSGTANATFFMDDVFSFSSEIIEFEFDVDITWLDVPGVGKEIPIGWYLEETGSGDIFFFAITINDTDGITPQTPNFEILLSNPDGTHAFSYESIVPPINKGSPFSLRFRMQKGQLGRCWLDPTKTGLWYELFTNQTSNIAASPTTAYTWDKLRILSWTEEAGMDFNLTDVRLYSVENVSIQGQPGLTDEDGNQIIGPDASDDGSGSNTGGEGGFGGGGLILQTLTFQGGGYVNAISTDVGLTLTGGTTGDTAKLVSFNNVAGTWIINPDASGDLFDVSEAITLGGGGTGAGTTSGASSIIRSVGGRLIDASGNIGLPGSGSEGNYDLTAFKGTTGTGDSSASGGSGFGIDILGYNYTREMDGFGYATVFLTVSNGWSALLNIFISKQFNLTEQGVTLFNGYVTEVETPDRYSAILTLREVTFKLTEDEAQKNYALVINTSGDWYDTVSTIATTRITLTQGDNSNIATDSTMAVLVQPGAEAANTTETFITILTGTASGGGDIDNMNTDNELYIGSGIHSIAEVELVYSGTVENITAFELEIKWTALPSHFSDESVVIAIYDWDAAAYETIETHSVGLWPFPGNIGKKSTPLIKVNSETPQNYFDGVAHGSTKKFKIKLDPSSDLTSRLYYATLKVFTEPAYDGTAAVINGVTDTDKIDSTSNFSTIGVNTGDTVIVGLKNTTVLAEIIAESYYNFTADIDADASFTGFTGSDFAAQHATQADAIRSVLKKEKAIFYYDPTTTPPTLFMKKKSDLTDTGIVLSNSSFKGGVQVEIVSAQVKQVSEYAGCLVTGNTYKVYDTEVSISHFERIAGANTNRILRITDTSINSVTEAKARAISELALITLAGDPDFKIRWPSGDTLPTITPGTLFDVQYHGTLYSDLPLRMINVDKRGNNPMELFLELGWKGSTPEDREIDETNDIRKRLMALEAGMSNRPTGSLLAEIESHYHPSRDFFNGTFRESFDAVITSDGATITMTLEKSGTGDLTMNFSDGKTTLDCTPALSIALTAGSAPSPQGNWIYILQSDKILTKSTTTWPSAEHIKVAFFFVQTAALVQSGDVNDNAALINQNHNDEFKDVTTLQGHVTDITARLRTDKAIYFSGVNGNGTDDYLTPGIGTTDFKSTSGKILQMHIHTYPAFDTSGTSVMHVVNWNADAYHTLTDLFDIVADSGGNAIGNNKYFNLVFWGVINKDSEHQTVMVNLPSGFYNTEASAENDVSGFDTFAIPREFNIDSSTGFLIARVTIKMAATWVVSSTVDLRGQTPQTAAGSAGNIATQFADNVFEIFDEADNTKEMAFDVGTLVTAGNKRTYQAPDASGVLALIDLAQTWTATQTMRTLLPSAAETYNLGSAAAEWEALFLGEGANSGLYFGIGQEVRFWFDNAATNYHMDFPNDDLFIDTGRRFVIRDTDDGEVALLLLNTSTRTLDIGVAADLMATAHYGKFTMVTASDVDNIAVVDNAATADYGAAWAGVNLPAAPVEGMTVHRWNSNGGVAAGRTYTYLNAAWRYIALT